MRDLRVIELAENILKNAVELKKGEKILISVMGHNVPLANELVKKSYEMGAIPYFEIIDDEFFRILLKNTTIEQMKYLAKRDLELMKEVQAYVSISSVENTSNLSDVPERGMKIYEEYYVKPVHIEERVNNTKWCLLRYPTNTMAKSVGMPTDIFEDYYFKVCNLDYNKMSKAMDSLVNIMSKTDKVHILGVDTDLTFSIKGMKPIKCDGKFNIPDGEVYTAPIRESVNGKIAYNISSDYHGFVMDNIKFEFKNGKIIKAMGNNNVRLNDILNTDEGARYIGEFAIGLNPYITRPMRDTLFDEKIAGSFHLTPGACYEDCDNGNKSVVHWDLVQVQTLEYGGGEIWFDDVLIRKNGIFVIDELKGLNPENLK